jgi:hypothetical protein
MIEFPADVDITGSTFVAVLSDKNFTATVDHSHLAEHYIVLSLDAATTAAIPGSYVEWELSESPVWSQAIFRRQVTFQARV